MPPTSRALLAVERTRWRSRSDVLVVEPAAQLERHVHPAELGVVAGALEDGAHQSEVAQRLVGARLARQLVAVVDGRGEGLELLLVRALPRAAAQLDLVTYDDILCYTYGDSLQPSTASATYGYSLGHIRLQGWHSSTLVPNVEGPPPLGSPEYR